MGREIIYSTEKGSESVQQVTSNVTEKRKDTMCILKNSMSISIYQPVLTICQRIATLVSSIKLIKDATPCVFKVDGVDSPIKIKAPFEIGELDEAKLKAAKANFERQIAAAKADNARATPV